MALYQTVVDQCGECLKQFAKLPDHPTRYGMPRCPYCMAIGLDEARAIIRALEEQVQILGQAHAN